MSRFFAKSFLQFNDYWTGGGRNKNEFKNKHMAEGMIMDAQQALAKLKEGNKRWVEGNLTARDPAREREKRFGGQRPYAAVKYCGDSGVPVEYIFDAGVGEIFGGGRGAGNIVDTETLGSMEYAAGHLGTKLFVVMGHTKCGALTEACKTDRAHGNLDYIVKELQPAVRAGKGDVEASILENVKLQVGKIRARSPLLAEMEKKGEIRILGAVYDIHTGVVKFL